MTYEPQTGDMVRVLGVDVYDIAKGIAVGDFGRIAPTSTHSTVGCWAFTHSLFPDRRIMLFPAQMEKVECEP